jgi:leader peptidase (prepilin peptidase)/N-methyltransferase
VIGPAPYPAVEATLVLLLGLMVGSFLNVCIYRLPRRLSPVRPRSACPTCGRSLEWYDNVPIVSYLLLRGRCRTCAARISPRYPIVEATTGAVFLAGYLWYGPSGLLLVRLLFACLLIVLFVIDLEHKLLPNVITLPGAAAGFLLSFLVGPGWLSSLAGMLVGAGSLFAIAELYYRLRHEEGLGMGDVKMLGMIGAFLGWKLVLVTLVLASFLGSIVGLGVLVLKKESLKYALPFGTFLAVAGVVAAVAGERLLAWYLGLYSS